MKKTIAIFFFGLFASLAMASPVSTTTATMTVSGQTITYNIASAQTTPYYRLAYDTGTKKIVALIPTTWPVGATGKTQTIYTLYCATTYAEVSAFATSNSLTGLPAKPANGP